MKYTAFLTTVAAGMFAVAMPAWAVSLQNNDDREYEVTIVTGGEESSSTFTLSPNGLEEGICDSCKISIDGVGDIDAQGDDVIEVSNGKLTRQGS